MMLSDVCLSVCRVHWAKSRTERPRKTKSGTEVAHVTRDLDTTFKVKRSKVKVTRPLYSVRRLRIKQLQRWQRWAWERIYRGNLLLRCSQARSARRREALRRPQREERGGAYCGGSRTACLKTVYQFQHVQANKFTSSCQVAGNVDICHQNMQSYYS